MKAFIEIPMHTTYKYEWDKEKSLFILDRPLNQTIPTNYGFFPESNIQADGDKLDVFVISDYPLLQGSLVDVNIQGILYCTDQGIEDNKVIAMLEGERPRTVDTILIKNYLKTYKDGFVVARLGTIEEALREINK